MRDQRFDVLGPCPATHLGASLVFAAGESSELILPMPAPRQSGDPRPNPSRRAVAQDLLRQESVTSASGFHGVTREGCWPELCREPVLTDGRGSLR